MRRRTWKWSHLFQLPCLRSLRGDGAAPRTIRGDRREAATGYWVHHGGAGGHPTAVGASPAAEV